MFCLLAILAFLGPRAGILFWYLVNPLRWQAAFSDFHTFIAPLAGSIFLPWTTIMFVTVAPTGHVQGYGWIWISLFFVLDLLSYSTGGYTNRARFATTTTTTTTY